MRLDPAPRDQQSSEADDAPWARLPDPVTDTCRSSALLVDSRTLKVDSPPAKAFEHIRRIGGKTGWYYADRLWRLRGVLDSLVGGVGLRGRRDHDQLAVGDFVDCWRVEAFEPDRRLLLALEMKQPGRGWLEFEVVGNGSSSTVRLTAMYDPRGLLGRIYWYLISPVHKRIFSGILRGIAARSASSPALR